MGGYLSQDVAPEFIRFTALCRKLGLDVAGDIMYLWRQTCRSIHEDRWDEVVRTYIECRDAEQYWEEVAEDALCGYDCEGRPIGG